MKYDDGQIVRLGDIVKVPIDGNSYTAKIIMLGETGSYIDIDDETAKWAIESQHVSQNEILVEWLLENPFALHNSEQTCVSNTLSTCLCHIVLVKRGSLGSLP